MMPLNISLIKYNGIGVRNNKLVVPVYFGGYKAKEARSFVCGFIDKTHAIKVCNKIPSESVRLEYNNKYGVCVMKTRLGENGGIREGGSAGGAGGPGKRMTKTGSKVPQKKNEIITHKPMNKKNLEIVTMDTSEASFFVAINNTQIMLIDDIAESETDGLLFMKNSYVINTDIDESLIMKQVSERYKTGFCDHNKLLDQILIDLVEDEEGVFGDDDE